MNKSARFCHINAQHSRPFLSINRELIVTARVTCSHVLLALFDPEAVFGFGIFFLFSNSYILDETVKHCCCCFREALMCRSRQAIHRLLCGEVQQRRAVAHLLWSSLVLLLRSLSPRHGVTTARRPPIRSAGRRRACFRRRSLDVSGAWGSRWLSQCRGRSRQLITCPVRRCRQPGSWSVGEKRRSWRSVVIWGLSADRW